MLYSPPLILTAVGTLMPPMVAESDSTTVFNATAVLAEKLKASGVVSITIVVVLNTGFAVPTVRVVLTVALDFVEWYAAIAEYYRL